jgi:hypothetical protein
MKRALAIAAALAAFVSTASEPPSGAPIEAAGISAATRIDAESVESAIALRDLAMQRSEAWHILESLTTEVGPRLAGSEGDARAVAWAQAMFQQLRYDKVWTEPVTFPVWERRAESGAILAPFPHQLALTALGGSVGTGRRGIEAEVIGFATLEALKQARAEDVRGKIVFIGNRMARARDGGGYGPAVAARVQGSQAAAALGARAILIRSIGTSSNRLPHTGVAVSLTELLADADAVAKLPKTRGGLPIPHTPIPAAALSNPDADILSRTLERSRPVRLKLVLDVGYRKAEYTSANVIGEIKGSERPEEVVLLGCHLDSWDLGTGAIDDGAGCAITMAAAFLIRQQGLKPRRSIRVVLFANEEQGIYGGKAYGTQHRTEVARHVIGAESDFGAGRIWRLDTKVKPEALAAIDQIMQVLAPIGVSRGLPYAFGGPDLGPMRDAGMPVLSLQQDGTTYFDIHHTANDTLDKIDPKALDQNVAVYAVFAWLAAQAEGDFGSVPAP